MPTIKILLYKQKVLKDKKHPVILQMTHKSKTSRISLGYRCHIEQWDFDKEQFKRGAKIENWKIKNSILLKKRLSALQIIDEIENSGKNFSNKLFKDLFQGNKKEIGVIEFYNVRMVELLANGKVSTKETYSSSRNALQKFAKTNNALKFNDVDYKFLKTFESYLFKGGCSNGGVSNYMRTLRAIFNEAIKRGYIERKYYPFKNFYNPNGYSIGHLKSKVAPRALSIGQMEVIKAFESSNYPKLEQSYYYFMFSYYSNGMNFIDMANLKTENVSNGRISYYRSKTGEFITLKITRQIQKILDYYSRIRNENFIFPILSEVHKLPLQQSNRIKKCRSKYNKDLKLIAVACNLDEKVTSYVSRHTFASTLLFKGVDSGRIGDSLGHKDKTSVNNYLKHFKNEELDKLSSLL